MSIPNGIPTFYVFKFSELLQDVLSGPVQSLGLAT